MKQHSKINTAMVLAAGLGTRMRPITERLPKPLVKVGQKTLLDHALDAIERAGVGRVFVNVHHLADQIENHLTTRASPAISISDERDALLDSGGGVKKALAAEPNGPLLILNADSFWLDAGMANATRLEQMWNPDIMDMLLLVARPDQAVGFDGAGDFFMDEDGRLTRRGKTKSAPYIYAGAIITNSQYVKAVKKDAFSLNRLFDQAISQKRLYGCPLNGLWLHVGTPASIAEAEQAIERYSPI
jgi:MurNAc alpha-1-phosphate uridylyltransferase